MKLYADFVGTSDPTHHKAYYATGCPHGNLLPNLLFAVRSDMLAIGHQIEGDSLQQRN